MNMSLFSVLRLSLSRTNSALSAQYATFAGGKMKKLAKKEKVEIPVETDINKLLTHVCGLNYYKEGEEVKLKPDDQYPEWLWSIRTEPLKLEDLDPSTKQYWRFIRRKGIKRDNRMKKYRKF